MYPNEECKKCGEKLPRFGGYYLNVNRHHDNRIHEECADFDDNLHPDSRTKFNSKKIQEISQKLEQENRTLRQRTSALSRELQKQMRANGVTEEQIQDFLYDYGLHQEESP